MQTSDTRIKRRFTALFFLSLCITLISSFRVYAAIPKADIPMLSLTGRENGYNNAVYSDGRIWLGYADTRIREILVPVYIKNLWYDSTNVTDKRYSGFPILHTQYYMMVEYLKL